MTSHAPPGLGVMGSWMVKFLIGVDGGGTGTRAVLADCSGHLLGRGSAGPAGLALGIAPAWAAIRQAIDRAAQAAGVAWSAAECALGAGLAGSNHPQWRAEFLRQNPGFAPLAIDSDAGIALLAAHGGRPGVMVAAGTGSVGGWGFPVGDEGSGAWLGMGAMRHAQCALDGRARPGALARAVWAACGADRDALLAWSLAAGQGDFAGLAPLVFACAGADPVAGELLDQAAQALETMALALDPQAALPVALMGSIARRLAARCSPALQARLSGGEAEAALGALSLIRCALEPPP